VGSGMAGCAGAVTAAESGLEALMVEKAPLLGGSTVYSYGILFVPGNHLQRDASVQEAPNAGREYMLYLGAERQSIEHVDAFLSTAPKALEYFAQHGGVQFYLVKGLPDHYYPVAP